MTTQIYTIGGKISALLALLKLRKADQKLIDRVNKFDSAFRGPNEMRNRTLHDMWFYDRVTGGMAQLSRTASKKLNFIIEPIPIDEMRKRLDAISELRAESEKIREAIKAALPHCQKYRTENFIP